MNDYKIIGSFTNPRGFNIYHCQGCPQFLRYFEIYLIENSQTGKVKKLCENCLEPYFRVYE